MARPKVYDINGEEVTKLASYGCTNKEIADFHGCSADLIEKSYSEYLIKGRSKGKIRLRQLQLKAAENGSAAILIWLGKQMLGQTDQADTSESEQPLPWSYD
jgi:hypothetical protein